MTLSLEVCFLSTIVAFCIRFGILCLEPSFLFVCFLALVLYCIDLHRPWAIIWIQIRPLLLFLSTVVWYPCKVVSLLFSPSFLLSAVNSCGFLDYLIHVFWDVSS